MRLTVLPVNSQLTSPCRSWCWGPLITDRCLWSCVKPWWDSSLCSFLLFVCAFWSVDISFTTTQREACDRAAGQFPSLIFLKPGGSWPQLHSQYWRGREDRYSEIWALNHMWHNVSVCEVQVSSLCEFLRLIWDSGALTSLTSLSTSSSMFAG